MKYFAVVMIGVFLIADTVAEEIGSVSTKFKWLGPNDKVVIEVG